MTSKAIAGIPHVLGGNVFGWTIDEPTSFAILDAFVAGGGAMIDTADAYSAWVPGHKGGESETVIGRWLKSSGKRNQIRIATKVGLLPGVGGEKLAPARIAAACDESLMRLGVEQIDLYYAHHDDPASPLEPVAEAFAKLIAAGKVATLGASNFTADRLASALDLGTPYAVIQPQYNLVERGEYEGALQDLAVARGLDVLPYYGLAAGFLTGKYRHKESTGSRAGTALKYLDDRGRSILAAMDIVSEETGASLAQIALAWLRAQPGITAPIASATTVAQLEQLIAGAHLALRTEQLERLDAASA
ncbi:MAG: alcohol dehydrogenase [Sphingomonadales bacterium]|nr:alcohol dehydrogenase [Sphingomonadales bacterium]